MEEWKVIDNTNNMFSISNYGKIRNNKTGRILKTQKNKKGYECVRVTINKEKKTFRLHRLVAFYFVENPSNKPQVNHIDGCKENNMYSNLEWVTNQENQIHAWEKGLWNNVFEKARIANDKKKKSIYAKNIETGEVIIFSSMGDAERTIGTKHINDVIKGNRTQAKGYTFSYYKGVV